jgi:hypothetical protein
MAVLIEGISVIVRADTLLHKYPGGREAFERIVPNQTLCADNELLRVGFMVPQDVESFVKKLQVAGLEFIRDGEAIDIAVADQMRGLTSKCAWLEFERVDMSGNCQFVAACRLVGSQLMQVVTPPGWKFEGSMSSTFNFVPNEHLDKVAKFLRHEKGIDVYLNLITGKEMYVGRTSES